MASREQPEDWKTIESAPRDGRAIRVTDFESGEYVMCYNAAGANPLFQKGIGIWESPDRSFTWSEERGYGPTHWKPYGE
mgnify:CR=1 FL=1